MDPNDDFVFYDLLKMCFSLEKYVIYEAIQATIACTQDDSRIWIIKKGVQMEVYTL